MLGNTIDFRRSLLRWYSTHRRDLPWRVARKSSSSQRPDPYHVLVSEAMLQQTQVATVIPYFNRFMAAYPTLGDLARANEDQILRLWQGLGYYSRARYLLRTAKILVEQKNGQIPATVEELLKLPGVGRYTAGAIASLAFETRAPILDGNVARVLSRLDLLHRGMGASPMQHGRGARATNNKDILWQRAQELLPKKRIGDFNSSLMELGATICTPRAPNCLLCPVAKHCAALAAGLAEEIPPPPAKKLRPLERRWTLAISCNNQWLIEQRPARGRWASMWQFITIAADGRQPSAKSLSKQIGLPLCDLRPLGSLRHDLTHRRYEFEVFACRARDGRTQGSPRQEAKTTSSSAPPNRRWIGLDGLSDFPLSRPQLEVAQMISSIIRG